MATTTKRRTLRLIDDLDHTRTSGSQVVLYGPAVHDLYVDEANRVLSLPDLIRSYCTSRNIGLLSYRMETGPLAQVTLHADGATPKAGANKQPSGRFIRPRDDEHPAQTISRIINDLKATAQPSILFLDYADLILRHDGPNDLGTAALIETVQALVENSAEWSRVGLQVILCDRGGGIVPRIPSQPGFKSIALDPPEAIETTVFLEKVTRPDSRHVLHLSDDLDIERASRLAGGLLLRNLAELAPLTSPSAPLTPRVLSDLKGEAIKRQSQNALDLMNDPIEFGAQVAGMPSLRLRVQDDLARGSDIRIALVGPPGTGKTYSAQAIASLVGAPLVSFGQILGELLGQAENNMRRALSILRAMAPVVLFIDEADQGPLGARSSSAQTGNEAHLALRAMLFEFFGDPGAQTGIHVVLTTNVPNHLDPRVKSRFKFVPCLFATGAELGHIMKIQAKRANIELAEDLSPVMVDYINSGAVLSGRSAQELLEMAFDIALRNSERAVTSAHVEAALAGWSGNDWDIKAEYSTLASLDMLKRNDSLPWMAAEVLGEHASVPQYMRPYLDASGVPKRDEVSQRLHELDAGRVW